MTDTEDSTGGDDLVAALKAHDVTDIFGLPGIQLDGALDALARSGGLSFYSLRHEQAASYLADGYARATGKTGVCMVVPGPGMLNATAGLATAYACSSPVLFISGQLPTSAIGKGLGLLHEIPDQTAILRGLTSSTFAVRSRDDVSASVSAAMRELGAGRPRPVGLEIPQDILHATARRSVIASPADDRPVIDEAVDLGDGAGRIAQMLREARRPVLYAGWGVHAADAHDALRVLAEKAGAVVVTSLTGPGAVPADHPLALTRATLRTLQPDLVVAVGSRFLKRDGTPELPPGTHRLAMINADPADTRAPRAPEAVLVADARRGLEAVSAQLGDAPTGSTWTEADVATAREELSARGRVLAPQRAWLNAIRGALPRESYLVSEMTQLGYTAPDFYPVHQPRGLITSGYQGSLGFGFATALGVKVGVSDAPVALISGDGGFGWTLQELATAARYDIGLISVVMRDDAFGNVRRIQRQEYDGRTIGDDLHNPDFVRLAESFGVSGVRVKTPEKLGEAIADASSRRHPVLIEVPVGEFPDPWPIVG